MDQGAGWEREGAWVWGQTTWRGPAGSSRLGAALTPPTGALTSRDALHLRAGQEQDGDCVLGPRHRGHCPQSPGACTGLPGSHSWAVCAPGWGPGQVPNSAPTRLQIQHPLSTCPLGLQGTALFLGLILQSVGFFFPPATPAGTREWVSRPRPSSIHGDTLPGRQNHSFVPIATPSPRNCVLLPQGLGAAALGIRHARGLGAPLQGFKTPDPLTSHWSHSRRPQGTARSCREDSLSD